MSSIRRLTVCIAGLGLCLWLVAISSSAAEPVVDINTASASELAARLRGIGPVKAQRIVAHREQHGPFATVEALEAVSGIGPKTVARLRESVTVGAALESRARNREARTHDAVRRVIARARTDSMASSPVIE